VLRRKTQRSRWPAPSKELDAASVSRAVKEYLATLDEAFGAASEVTPKFVLPSDPAAQWTGAMRGPAFFAYADNYLVDVKSGIIMDVEASRAIRQAEVGAAKIMIERTEQRLKRIGVIAHPRSDDGLPPVLFTGEGGLVMRIAFNAAYEAAEAFSRLYAARCPGAGFLKTILLRRIGSSAKAGLETARHILGRIDVSPLPEDEVGDKGLPTEDAPPDPQEIELLRDVERNLAAVVVGTGTDPKVEVILHYLRERNWLERNGAIIFSQYRTTAEWLLEALCGAFPDEPVALYAGGAASFVQRGPDRRTAAREQIKSSIQLGDIRLVCATDAASEGLNLQRLGAQVNVDLPGIRRGLNSVKGVCKGFVRFETKCTS
jgi:hypothetical protein